VLGFLKNPKYNLYPLLKFMEKYMAELRQNGVVWGYDLQYMFTGLLNRHPREAIAYTEQKRADVADFYHSLLENE
jgi:4-hydroxy 2-oxovalerate aldolase